MLGFNILFVNDLVKYAVFIGLFSIILFFVYASFALKIKPKQNHVKERKQKPVQLKLPIE